MVAVDCYVDRHISAPERFDLKYFPDCHGAVVDHDVVGYPVDGHEVASVAGYWVDFHDCYSNDGWKSLGDFH